MEKNGDWLNHIIKQSIKNNLWRIWEFKKWSFLQNQQIRSLLHQMSNCYR